MTDKKMIMGDYIPYCRYKAQRELIACLDKHNGDHKAVAKEMGKPPRDIRAKIDRIKLAAARQGYAPDHDLAHPVPEGTRLRGASILYDEDGIPKMTWVKSQFDEQAYQHLLDDLEAELRDRIPPCGPLPRRVAGKQSKDTMVVVPIGDPHIGMYAWADECGDDFDVDIARDQLLSVFDALMVATPRSDECVILNLGDFFHADDTRGVTARGGNHLDTDTRWGKVLRVGIQIMVDCVARAMQRHRTVVVRNCIGNHDDHTSLALTYAVDAYYRNAKRVQVETSPGWFWYRRFGKCLIGATHGDKTSLAQLPLVMAADRPADWGDTEYRYWYSGHTHQTAKYEAGGVVCESFRTLAAKDAYAASHGWRSGRDMTAITLHREYGEIARNRIDIRCVT